MTTDDDLCHEPSRDGAFHCTRPHYHLGRHRSTATDGTLLAVWSRDETFTAVPVMLDARERRYLVALLHVDNSEHAGLINVRSLIERLEAQV